MQSPKDKQVYAVVSGCGFTSEPLTEDEARRIEKELKAKEVSCRVRNADGTVDFFS